MCIIKSVTKISICISERSSCCGGSVPADTVCLGGPVNAEEQLCGQQVPQVPHALGAGVLVVVSSLPVLAETVGVLQAQVKALSPEKRPWMCIQVNCG